MKRGSLFRAEGDEPKILVQTVQFGELGHLWPNIRGTARAGVSGAGTGLDSAQALVPAVGEAIERYCSSVYKPEQFINATAIELGKRALDLDLIPRCSSTELAHPKCRLVAPRKDKPIRWVEGISLHDGRRVFLPAVMVYLFTGFSNAEERFWYPISTGCAAHTSLEKALLAAILEVIERDALSLVWLQKMPLPRIHIDSVPALLAPYWEAYQRSTKQSKYLFFDATTDIGVPTIYGVNVSRANPAFTTLVHCSTSLDPAAAIMKVIRDMASCRVAFRQPRAIPESCDDFTDTSHGALYMARSEHAHAFEFLLESPSRRPLSQIRALSSGDEKSDLEHLCRIFRQKNLDMYAVELSTDEALRAGIRVVRVLIPGLQPVGFHYRARYQAHPRLYDAPRRMGYFIHSEEQLNRWPQPFA